MPSDRTRLLGRVARAAMAVVVLEACAQRAFAAARDERLSEEEIVSGAASSANAAPTLQDALGRGRDAEASESEDPEAVEHVRHAGDVEADEAVEVDTQAGRDPIAPARIRRRAPPPRGPDPWKTRTNVSFTGASAATTDTRMPLGALGDRHRGEGSSGVLGFDAHGRWMGFHFTLGGTRLERDRALAVEGVGAAEERAVTTVDSRASLTVVLWRTRGVFVAAGPSLEGRLSTVGSIAQARASAGSWQTVVGGGDLRTRIFFGRHVYASANVFAGFVPVAGGWQALDVDAARILAGDDRRPVTSSSLDKATVFGGTAAFGLRPFEPLAISAGVSLREARYRFADGTRGSEHGLRPFLGLDLFY